MTKYSVVTPKRPEAICFVLLQSEIPSNSSWNRSLSSPPSPVLLRVPSLFMASASASWASLLMAPNDIAPVTKWRTMSSTGSTSSMGMGFFWKPKKSRRKIGCGFSSTKRENSLNFL